MIKAFVSSTYRDLREHRAYVIERLQRGGIYVDPMEKWTAASDEPKEISQERVRDCDLCILLVGFRRGYISEGETLSITQLEFREARRLGMDVLVFMAQETADWTAESMAELKTDPELVKWRAELQEHFVVTFFNPLPGSVDVDAAVMRWLGENQDRPERIHPDQDEGYSIEIRAYSNVESNLVVWRTEKPIPGCLGFTLHKKVLGTAGISEQVVQTSMGFGRETWNAPQPSTVQPIQRFRWTDKVAPGEEARYRVVPLLGQPGYLQQPVEATSGSSWTGWVSPQNRQTPEFQPVFNRAHDKLRSMRYVLRKTWDEMLKLAGDRRSEERAKLGGSMLSTLLQLLTAARRLDQRIYVAVPDLDDAELVDALSALGSDLHLLLDETAGQAERRPGVLRKLERAGVHLNCLPRGFGHQFMVICDRWGTPARVWTGSGPWTTEELCLRGNHALLVDSVDLARSYLDRWELLRDAADSSRPARRRRKERPEQIRLDGTSLTLWNTPVANTADLRDVTRMVRGAREGILFLLSQRETKAPVLDEILQVGREDLFVQGIASRVRGNGKPSITLYDPFLEGRTLLSDETPIDSNMIVIDPFGPHPVVICGSHDLGPGNSSRGKSDLLIVENAPGLATECAVHIIRCFDYYRYRSSAAQSAGRKRFIGLQADDQWQQRYFEKVKRSEFNFFFGSLWPGMD